MCHHRDAQNDERRIERFQGEEEDDAVERGEEWMGGCCETGQGSSVDLACLVPPFCFGSKLNFRSPIA